jgi:tetratricopeptide (TPR) repeat protein
MSETLEYIDTYFNGGMSLPEKEAFEGKCESDPAFAEEVAFYISARADVKNTLRKQKKQEFHDLYVELSSKNKVSKKASVLKLVPYIAAVAACILLFWGYQLFFKEGSSQASKNLADTYIKENMQQLSVTMGGDKDSLQLGIDAFNNKNYNEAESIFIALSSNTNVSAEAVKNLGTVYLVSGKYEAAITQFKKLANQANLFVNPGLFYEAIALMERAAPGDKEKAKQILEEVVKKDLAGSKEAKDWLQKL